MLTPLPLYPNYSVSDDGRIWSHKTNNWLSSTIDDKGYCRSYIFKSHTNGKSRNHTVRVHRLVAEAYLPNPNKLTDVNHKDGNKQNNQVSNLEWCSHSDNVKHAINTLGKISSLTDRQVEQIKEIYEKTSLNQTEIGNIFHVHNSTISYIVNGIYRKT